MIHCLRKLSTLLDSKAKRFFGLMLGLSVIFAVMEAVGISAVMPFLSVVTNPQLVRENKYYAVIYQYFSFSSPLEFATALGIFLVAFYVLRGAFSFAFTYLSHSFSWTVYSKLSNDLFESNLNAPYISFVNKNSAEIIRNVTQEAINASSVATNFLAIFTECFVTGFIYITLLLINVKMTLILTGILVFKVLVINFFFSRIIYRHGKARSEISEKIYRMLTETGGNFKIIKLLGNSAKVVEKFKSINKQYSQSNVLSNTFIATPRIILETLGFSSLVIATLYMLFQVSSPAMIIPSISIYALALYRGLPALTRILVSYNGILFYKNSVDLIADGILSTKENLGSDSISFQKEIRLQNISFSYKSEKAVLNNKSDVIRKGEAIGIIGASGSGKSTFVDIITGVYTPTEGQLWIDDTQLTKLNVKSWRSKIGYIPQSIYLFDGTVAENVAFGHPYDEKQIIRVLQQANIYDYLRSAEGIHTFVGEGGIQLSGGQKQRIGIARALYTNPELLILDEATSSLDQTTEAKIMDEIYTLGQGKTMLIIAHRKSTLEKCHRIIELG